MMVNMGNNIDYVLPLGQPSADGGLSRPSWRVFVQWISQLADHLLIWTQRPQADVGQWFGIDDSEMVRIAHPDPACSLVGYRMSVKLLDPERVSHVRVSEDSGVAHFSWNRGDAVLASVDVDDFENFAIINVETADAVRLAKACSDDSWDRDLLLANKAEIDGLSATGHWVPLSDVVLHKSPEAGSPSGDGAK
jgi:hypothetical protein